MGVLDRGRTVCCPSRVSDPGGARERRGLQHAGKLLEFAGRAAAVEAGRGRRGNAGAVIAAVFQALERVEDGCRRSREPTTPKIPHMLGWPFSWFFVLSGRWVGPSLSGNPQQGQRDAGGEPAREGRLAGTAPGARDGSALAAAPSRSAAV